MDSSIGQVVVAAIVAFILGLVTNSFLKIGRTEFKELMTRVDKLEDGARDSMTRTQLESSMKDFRIEIRDVFNELKEVFKELKNEFKELKSELSKK